MRVLARIGYTLAGLALIAPAAARAGMPIPAPGPGMALSPKPRASTARKERLCAACQREKLIKAGVRNVPPAPALPPGVAVAGDACTRCGAATAVVSGPMIRPSRVAPSAPGSPVMVADGSDPGRATVGGDTGYAVLGADPVPIGVIQPRVASAVPSAPSAGTRDGAVMPTSASSGPMAADVGEKQPHILTHLFGLSALGRERAATRARRQEEKHAMIPYGAAPAQVNEVPASVIYGR